MSRGLPFVWWQNMPMSVCAPDVIVLTLAERAELSTLVRHHRAQARHVLRPGSYWPRRSASATLTSPCCLGVHVDTVRKWRRRFATEGMAGLADRKRPGRPNRFTDVQAAQVKALACELPATLSRIEHAGGGVTFHLPHRPMIRLLRECGFVMEDLLEVQPAREHS